MIAGPKFALFLLAALVLAVMPGRGILYLLGCTINGGRRQGVASAWGTFVGGLVYAFAAAIGLSALLGAFAAAFQFVRYAGGGVPHLSRHHDDPNAPSFNAIRGC